MLQQKTRIEDVLQQKYHMKSCQWSFCRGSTRSCVCVCVCACARACVCACVCVWQWSSCCQSFSDSRRGDRGNICLLIWLCLSHTHIRRCRPASKHRQTRTLTNTHRVSLRIFTLSTWKKRKSAHDRLPWCWQKKMREETCFGVWLELEACQGGTAV